MESNPPVERNRFLEREPSELVAKRDARGVGREHARAQAFLEPRHRLGRKRFQQPEVGL